MTLPDSQLRAALRICWEAGLYRLRRREANNVLTSLSLALAFGLPALDIVFRAGFAVVLNLYVYLMNDYYDVEIDLASSQKDRSKARFLADHRPAALGALSALALLLCLAAALHWRLFDSWVLLVALAANTVVVLVYSAWLKRYPLADVLMMTVWGGTMALVGLPPASLLAWKLIGLLALLCASFEVIQVIRDEPEDRAAGLLTTAVLLGSSRSAWLFRGIIAAAGLYGLHVVGSFVPLALGLAALLPLRPANASRSWDIARLLFGVIWLGLLIQVWLGALS